MIRRFKFILLLCIICIGSGCRYVSQDDSFYKYRESRILLGTVVAVDACYAKGQEDDLTHTFEELWGCLEDINKRMNAFDEDSEVYRINHSSGKPVTVSPDTYQLLNDSVHYSKLTDGAFDITVWPLVQLWRDGEKTNTVPTVSEIDSVRNAVGSKNIRFLDRNAVQLRNRKTMIDLGGIAKGYAVDEAARIFRKNGFGNFLIDAGGDIFVGGNNCKAKPWRVGIRHPRKAAQLVQVLGVTNAAITTSGDYQQYYEIQGKRWSHIINPTTGYPQRGVVSATVIAPTAREADALSTALCVLGGQRGIELINGLKNERIAAMIIEMIVSGESVVYKSADYDRLLSQNIESR